jgi:uncharacterized repeat protein (TIGR03803 family)
MPRLKPYSIASAASPSICEEKILYTFGSQAGDGNTPIGGLVFDAAGNLYGVTADGGAYGSGTVFEITP